MTRASTGTGRPSGLRDGLGAAGAGAPTAGPRRPGRWPWKPPLLGHAQVSAAPVPPAARVGRDPAPGESGRPPRRGARAVPSPRLASLPRAEACAGGPAGKMSPLGALSFARGSATGQRPPEARRPCPRTGSRGSTAARRAGGQGTSTEPGQRDRSSAMRAAQPRAGHLPAGLVLWGPCKRYIPSRTLAGALRIRVRSAGSTALAERRHADLLLPASVSHSFPSGSWGKGMECANPTTCTRNLQRF